MGKKPSGGGNSKVEAANARKAVAQSAKDAKASAAAAAAESAEWSKGSNARGESRKAEEERKKQEAEARKAELKRLQALEEHSMAKLEDKSAARKFKTKEAKELNKPWEEALKPAQKKNNRGSKAPTPAAAAAGASGSGKLTQAQMRALREAEEAEYAKKQSSKGIQFETPSFRENRNRDAGGDAEARSIESALDVLTLGDKDLEKHPERRAKAAYKAFEEATLPELKSDFPGLKLSQYKQKLSEMWRRSPQNPLNQESLAYNAKKQ